MSGASGANLTESEKEDYSRAGLGPEEAVRWKQARIEPIVARRAREVGLTLEQTAVGVREMWFPTQLRKLLDRGASLDELGNWESAGGDALFVIWALDRGMDHEQFSKLVDDLYQVGSDPESLEECRQ